MASFDIVSKIDLQELDNSVNSVLRELTNRFDFKGAKFSLDNNDKENTITILAEDEYKLSQIQGSLKSWCIKRGIDAKALDFQKEEPAANNSYRQIVKIKEGIDSEAAKKIIKEIKARKMKVQASIRGEEVRVEGKKRDDLQDVMSMIKTLDTEVPLQFINFRD